MKRISLVGLAVLLMVVGCTSLPGLTPRQSKWMQGELPVGEPGAKMAEYRFRATVRQWMHANEIDPDRCKFDWDSSTGWYGSERHGLAVWMRGVHVNAKDQTGRYMGYQPFIFVVRNGQLVDIIGASTTPLTAR